MFPTKGEASCSQLHSRMCKVSSVLLQQCLRMNTLSQIRVHDALQNGQPWARPGWGSYHPHTTGDGVEPTHRLLTLSPVATALP